eukprot:357613-Chlamydomonas_euryale.AAC.8
MRSAQRCTGTFWSCQEGQFLASGDALRRRGRFTYQRLLQLLDQPAGSWVHDDARDVDNWFGTPEANDGQRAQLLRAA